MDSEAIHFLYGNRESLHEVALLLCSIGRVGIAQD
nr:MAG TPA: hypothetical protein [Caudoviricetes sp.]